MKIGAIGIRTKIIVGDAATWHLVKKYLDNVVIKGGITPEEKTKLAGIEENANNYTHPETHPASILDVVDVVNGAANKFFNERGKMGAVAHKSLTDKNSEAAFQHIDTTTTKPALVAADMVAIKDSVTGKMALTPKTQFAMTAQEAWITPTLLNGWVRFNETLSTAQFFKDSMGIVHLRGIVKSGTNATIFALPSGYRPSATTYIATVSNGVFGYITIGSGGSVIAVVYSNAWISLENISFKAEL